MNINFRIGRLFYYVEIVKIMVDFYRDCESLNFCFWNSDNVIVWIIYQFVVG